MCHGTSYASLQPYPLNCGITITLLTTEVKKDRQTYSIPKANRYKICSHLKQLMLKNKKQLANFKRQPMEWFCLADKGLVSHFKVQADWKPLTVLLYCLASGVKNAETAISFRWCVCTNPQHWNGTSFQWEPGSSLREKGVIISSPKLKLMRTFCGDSWKASVGYNNRWRKS